MATLPIHLDVEAEALGPVLIALRKMPGIIKIELDLLSGMPGAPVTREPKTVKGSNTERILAMLVAAKGESVTLKDFVQALHVPKSSLYTSFTTLKKQGVLMSGGVGAYKLTPRAAQDMLGVGMKMLPKPNGVQKTPSGRQPAGHGRAVLLAVLAQNPGSRGDVTKIMSQHGISDKSVSGLFDRAKRDNLIKKNGNNWELTAAGVKAQTAEK